jgi:hypothetical protein
MVWPIGSYIYGLLKSEKAIMKWIGGGLLIMGAISGSIVLSATDRVINMESTQFNTLINELDQMETSDLTREQLKQLKASLRIVQKDMQTNWFNFNKKSNASILFDLFAIITEDRHITFSDYNDWMNKFESRDILDASSFREYVNNLK